MHTNIAQLLLLSDCHYQNNIALMLRNTLKFFCSETPSHLRELLRKCQTLQQDIEVSNQKLLGLRTQFAEEEKKLSTRNKQIHELRTQLTNDVRRGEEIWKSARNKSEQHKNESVQNFAQGLVGLTKIIKEATKLESEAHDADIKEGFHLTSRLYFSTLNKYKIVEFSPADRAKFNKDEMIAESQLKAESEKDRGLVAKVIEPGFSVEGKVVYKAKVQVYN